MFNMNAMNDAITAAIETPTTTTAAAAATSVAADDVTVSAPAVSQETVADDDADVLQVSDTNWGDDDDDMFAASVQGDDNDVVSVQGDVDMSRQDLAPPTQSQQAFTSPTPMIMQSTCAARRVLSKEGWAAVIAEWPYYNVYTSDFSAIPVFVMYDNCIKLHHLPVPLVYDVSKSRLDVTDVAAGYLCKPPYEEELYKKNKQWKQLVETKVAAFETVKLDSDMRNMLNSNIVFAEAAFRENAMSAVTFVVAHVDKNTGRVTVRRNATLVLQEMDGMPVGNVEAVLGDVYGADFVSSMDPADKNKKWLLAQTHPWASLVLGRGHYITHTGAMHARYAHIVKQKVNWRACQRACVSAHIHDNPNFRCTMCAAMLSIFTYYYGITSQVPELHDVTSNTFPYTTVNVDRPLSFRLIRCTGKTYMLLAKFVPVAPHYFVSESVFNEYRARTKSVPEKCTCPQIM